MPTAMNGYAGARTGTGLLITAAVHVALGAALLSLGVVKIGPKITPPIRLIDPAEPEKPLDQPVPPIVDEPIDPIYTPPVVTYVDDPLPTERVTATTDLWPPKPVDFSTGVTPPTKPVDPVIVGSRLDPRYAARFQPPYPPASERQEEEGVVIVRVRVGPDGRVLSAELKASSGHRRLDESAVAHARRAWRFVPATRDGLAVESWREIPVRFELKNG